MFLVNSHLKEELGYSKMRRIEARKLAKMLLQEQLLNIVIINLSTEPEFVAQAKRSLVNNQRLIHGNPEARMYFDELRSNPKSLVLTAAGLMTDFDEVHDKNEAAISIVLSKEIIRIESLSQKSHQQQKETVA